MKTTKENIVLPELEFAYGDRAKRTWECPIILAMGQDTPIAFINGEDENQVAIAESIVRQCNAFPTLKADNERLTNQAAQLREALQGVTRENEGMRDALCQVRDIARNCLQGAVPAVAKITFGLPIKTMLAIACASLDSIQSQTAGGKGDK